MRYRFGYEKDFQLNMEYRRYLTPVHFEWVCPACGCKHNDYHEEGCPIERKTEDGDLYERIQI